MNKVITCNLEDDFLKLLGDYIEDHYVEKGKDMSRLAIVFGGTRPRLFLHKELAQRINKTFIPPHFFAIDGFVDAILLKEGVFTSMPDLDACFIMYKLAAKQAPEVLAKRGSFAQFLPWAREILGFIDQMDLEVVESSLLKNIQHNASIGYDVPESINTLLAHMGGLREAFHKIMLEKKSYTRGFKYLLASRLVATKKFDEFDEIYLCNLFYLHKSEEVVFKKLYADGKTTLFFQGGQEAWSVLDKMAKAFDCVIKPPVAREPEQDCHIYSSPDLHTQVCHVREILKTIKNLDKTVIVLPDSESIIPLLSEIAGSIGDFNISLGYSVKRSSLYSLFECLFKAQETKKGTTYYVRDYLRLLSHPLVKNLKFTGDFVVTRVLVHKIEEILVGIEKTPLGGSLFLSLEAIENEQAVYAMALDAMERMDVDVTTDDLKSILKALHALLFRRWEPIHNLHDFSQVLEELLDGLLHRSLIDKYPLNSKVVATMLTMAEEFDRASFKQEFFAQADIFKIFMDKLDHEMISFMGSPLKGLQILGLFETRSLCFENVIVLDANESILPTLKICEPLIPRDVMLGLGLNRLEKEEEIQRYQFMRLLAAASHVHLFYQETAEKEKSRFVEELIWKKQKALKQLDAGSITHSFFDIKTTSKEIEIAKRQLHISFLEKFSFSASSVDTYLRCPLRFYYQSVLGLKETEAFLEEPEASDVGTFIHHVCEEAFKQFVGKPPCIDTAFKKYFFNVLDDKFEKEFVRKMKSDAFLMKEVIDLRLSRFLEHEARREVKTLECVEKVFEDTIRSGAKDYRFKAKIDRIDRLSDESLLIIDYKTGSSDIMPSVSRLIQEGCVSRQALKKSVKSFQLPLYYYLVSRTEKDVKMNAVLYNIRDPKGFEAGRLFKNEETLSQRKEILDIFMEALGFILKEITDRDVPFRADEEDSRYCQNCSFFYLCR